MEQNKFLVDGFPKGVDPTDLSSIGGRIAKKNKATEWTPAPEDMEDMSVYTDEVLTLEEAIEEVAKEEGLTVEEVKQHLHKFQRDLYKKYTKKKVDKIKAKSKKKQIKKSKKKNR